MKEKIAGILLALGLSQGCATRNVIPPNVECRDVESIAAGPSANQLLVGYACTDGNATYHLTKTLSFPGCTSAAATKNGCLIYVNCSSTYGAQTHQTIDMQSFCTSPNEEADNPNKTGIEAMFDRTKECAAGKRECKPSCCLFFIP